MSNYSTYQKFFSPEEAEPILLIVRENNIPFEFLKSRKRLDNVILGEAMDDLYELNIPASSFEKLNKLLQEKVQVNIDELEPDYYLFSFTNEELKDILRKPDEWSPQDYAIARHLLAQKGISYSDEDLLALKKERKIELALPEKEGKFWLITGYFFTIFLIFYVGIFVGLVLWQVKKTLPDGSKVYVYSTKARKRGETLMIVSFIWTAIVLLLNLRTDFTAWERIISLW